MPSEPSPEPQADDDALDLFETAPCGYLSTDPAGRILRVNETFAGWLGRPKADLIGLRFQDLLSIVGKIFYETHFAPLLRMQGFFHEVAFDLIGDAGQRLPVLVNAVERRAAEGTVRFNRITVFSASDRRRYEAELLAAQRQAEAATRRLTDVLESTTDCVFITDREWRLQFVNQRAKDLFQLGELQIGQSVWEQFPGVEDTPFGERLKKAWEDQEPVTFEEYVPPLDLWVDVHAYPSAEGMSFFYRDITARRKAREELQYAARHDGLTGLLNRSCLHQHLEVQLASPNVDSQTAVLFLDLDEFKSVNDALGHPAGDQLLKETATRLKACLRKKDILARFGGDEFVILMSGVRLAMHAEDLARRIIERVSAPFRLDHQDVTVGVSIGIAVAGPQDTDADELLKRADIALYQAKADGRGICRLFRPGLDIVAKDQQRLRQDLRDATRRREFRLHFQPIVELGTDRVTAFEALLRWQHPWRGLLQPAEFISLAESTGVIVEIGAWVLLEACCVAASWPEDISISVNLSPRQFRGHDLIETVKRALSQSGLAPTRLVLEITETVLLQDDDTARETLVSLRRLGVRVSIDDFGTGYSSLSYLQRLTVDNIKIDRSFVAELAENERSSAILRALVGLAGDLRLSLTAEGIETVEQLERLRALGYRQGQGYLFAPPIPPERTADFIAKGWRGARDREGCDHTRRAG